MEPAILKTFPADMSNQWKLYWLCYGYKERSGSLEGVKYLVENGLVDVNVDDEDEGTSAFSEAVASYKIDIVKFLLDNGIDIKGGAAKRGLRSAISHSHFDIIELLVARGIEINASDLEWAKEVAQLNKDQNLAEKYKISIDVIEYLEEHLPVPIENKRPAVNEKINSMPKEWKDNNLDDMTCPVCWGIYFKPLTFSCGHTMCKPCFAMIAGGPARKCPECNQVIGAENPNISISLQKHCDKLREYVKQVGGKGKNNRKTKAKAKAKAKAKRLTRK